MSGMAMGSGADVTMGRRGAKRSASSQELKRWEGIIAPTGLPKQQVGSS
jgi:hypothetical protein